MSIESLKQQARKHEQNEDWIKALDQYRKALDELASDDQVDIGLYNRVGDLYVRVGNLAEAVDHYEKAVELYREAYLPNNAIAVCKKIIRNVPDRHRAYLVIGQIRAEQGFLPDARTNFLTYAERMQQDGDLDESFRALVEFCDLAPDDVGVRITVAEQMAAQSREDEAVEQLLIAHRHYVQVGEPERAEEVAAQIRGIDPEADVDALSAAGIGTSTVGADGEIMADFGEISLGHDPFGSSPSEAEVTLGEAVEDSADESDAEEAGQPTAGDEAAEVDAGLGDFEIGSAASAPVEEDDEEEESEPLPTMDFDTDDDEDHEPLPTMDFGSDDDEEERAPLPTMELESDDEEEAEPLPTMDFGDDEGEEEAEPLPTMDFDEGPEDAGDIAAEPLPTTALDSDDGAGEADAETAEPLPTFDFDGAPDDPDAGSDELIDTAAGEISSSMEEAVEDAAAEVEVEPAPSPDAGSALDFTVPDEPIESAPAAADPEPDPPAAEPAPPAAEPPPAEPEPAAPTEPAPPASGSDEGFVDLGAMILGGGEEKKSTRFTVAYEEPSGDEQADFARMLSQFKDKVSENLDTSDVRAHYDLGTAYKEMGLLDEAIGSFQAALRASADHLPTYELMGQTFIEMGQPEAAVKSLRRAVEVANTVEDELVGIYYYLGRAYEDLENKDSAVEFYDRVFSLDINFADVTERLRGLR